MLDDDDGLHQVMAIRGALGASVAGVVQASLASGALGAPGQPCGLDEIVINAENGYHLVRAATAQPGSQLVLYLWLDRIVGNLAMAQRQLRLVTLGPSPAKGHIP